MQALFKDKNACQGQTTLANWAHFQVTKNLSVAIGDPEVDRINVGINLLTLLKAGPFQYNGRQDHVQ